MPRLFFWVPVSVRPHSISCVVRVPKEFLVALPNNITVPIRDFYDEIPAAVRDALTREAAPGSKPGCERELFVLAIVHFVQCFEAFADNTMARRARAHPAAGMINVDAIRERDVQDAAGQPGCAIGDLFRIDFHGHIHRNERDSELLRRGLRRILVDVRVCAAHKTYSSALTSRPAIAVMRVADAGRSRTPYSPGPPSCSRTNGTNRTGTVSRMSTRKASCFVTSLSTWSSLAGPTGMIMRPPGASSSTSACGMNVPPAVTMIRSNGAASGHPK